MSDTGPETLVAELSTLEDATELRRRIMASIDHAWVLVKKTKGGTVTVEVMNGWQGKLADDKLKVCAQLALDFQEENLVVQADELNIREDDEDVVFLTDDDIEVI